MTSDTLSAADPAETLYARLKNESQQFNMLRMEPHFSTVELDELVAMAAAARDNANWLRAQRDEATAALLAARRENETLRAKLAPCGECHIQPGETCDICGKVQHE